MKLLLQSALFLIVFFSSFIGNANDGVYGRDLAQFSCDSIPAKASQQKKRSKGEMDSEFVGGQDSMMAFINRNLNLNNADTSLKRNIKGTVNVRFTIAKDGAVKKVHLDPKSSPLGYGLDEEAIRVVSSMPRWKPAMINGNPVRSYKILPIVFKIETESSETPEN